MLGYESSRILAVFDFKSLDLGFMGFKSVFGFESFEFELLAGLGNLGSK